MRGSTPTIHCDAEDGFCGNWDVDNYETGASRVAGVRITATERAPGWVSGNAEDFCPEHAQAKEI